MYQTAIITGASSGIGKEISFQLAELGYKVVLVSRSKSKLNLISKEIKHNGGDCLVFSTDLSNPNEIYKFKKDVSQLDNITVVVNNAGFGKFSKIEDVALEEWNLHMNVNVRSAFLISQIFLPKMKKIKKGSLLFINSVAGKKGYPNSAAYVASKYAMRGLADSFREELREHNIKVISIYPGAVNSPFWDNINVDFEKREMLDVRALTKSIIHAISSPGNLNIEEMLIRRTAGDF